MSDIKDEVCIYYGDCPFYHMECEEDTPHFKCPDRKLDKDYGNWDE